MTWADGIDHALTRARSPFRFSEWFEHLRAGRMTMYVAPHMTASLLIRDNGAEIGHVYGHWCSECAAWCLECAQRDLDAAGLTNVEVTGRAGWRRFLEAKGVMKNGIWRRRQQ